MEYSLITFDQGKNLLSRIKEMSLFENSAFGKHGTSSACYSIENLLELLNNRRLHLEELWKQKKLKIEYGIQICYLRAEIKKTYDWIINVGSKHLEDSRLGTNYKEAIELKRIHAQFEKDYQKVGVNNFISEYYYLFHNFG